jgi:hypothetical protein
VNGKVQEKSRKKLVDERDSPEKCKDIKKFFTVQAVGKNV